MESYDLYDVTEDAKVRFVGFAVNEGRYDFGIVYSDQFFGKPLVICMQTGHSALLDSSDIDDLDYLQKKFHLRTLTETIEVASFLEGVVPLSQMLEESYE
ncbi:SAV0927 family protein [Thalassobacillus hwangdonensis]|uniref:SAV0927 family protein n=1 Tax=Thalassobacillus hwangdonensis TaxID=546108 RepID=A0ABW3KWU3_9BACI